MPRLDFRDFDALTFDCYGTLIDWELGILDALRPVLGRHGVAADEDELLAAYARSEADLERGDYLPYREVLAGSFRSVCHAWGVTPTAVEVHEFAQSPGRWPAFADSAGALRRLATRFRLGVITNCDDDLFARSNTRLGITFDWIVTAERARSYKPSTRNFELALAVSGVARDRILHVAQSLYHDHVPAKQLGLRTAWVDRRQGRDRSGATPPAMASPDLTVPDLQTFADLALV
jgi:2-haloacid dehalogenase